MLGLLAELDETVLIVELDSVLMLLDDSTDDELFTLELEAFFDEALLDDLIIELFLLDALLELFTELDFLLDELLMLELEAFFDEALLKPFTLELFTGRLPPR